MADEQRRAAHRCDGCGAMVTVPLDDKGHGAATCACGAAIEIQCGPSPCGSIRVGTDGRFAFGRVECARCGAPLDARGLRVVVDCEDYPTATFAGPTFAAHLAASPDCTRLTLPRGPYPKPPLGPEWGIVAHVVVEV